MKYLALLTIYLIWGSTYLAVKIGLQSLPPFAMIGTRLLIAGAILFLFGRLRGGSSPNLKQWVNAGIVGTLLLVTGLGAVVWAEQTVPSGLAALLISTVPIWMVVLEYSKTRRSPGSLVWTGSALGLLGIGLLLHSLGELRTGQPVPVVGVVVVLLAAIGWAKGSLLSRTLDLPNGTTVSTGAQMLVAGLLLSVISLGVGEQVLLSEVSSNSLLAFVYLTLFGSIIAFSSYIWLLKTCDPGFVATYAYVNPIVALVLGATLGGEVVGASSVMACGVTILGVSLIVTGNLRRQGKSVQKLTHRTSFKKRRAPKAA